MYAAVDSLQKWKSQIFYLCVYQQKFQQLLESKATTLQTQPQVETVCIGMPIHCNFVIFSWHNFTEFLKYVNS